MKSLMQGWVWRGKRGGGREGVEEGTEKEEGKESEGARREGGEVTDTVVTGTVAARVVDRVDKHSKHYCTTSHVHPIRLQ